MAIDKLQSEQRWQNWRYPARGFPRSSIFDRILSENNLLRVSCCRRTALLPKIRPAPFYPEGQIKAGR